MDETPKSLIPTENVVAPSLDAVSPERRAAALQAVSAGRTWAWELGPTSLPKPQHRKLLNRAALPADVRTKLDAIEAAGMFVDVGGEVIGDATPSSTPVVWDHLTFGQLDGPHGTDRAPVRRHPVIRTGFAVNLAIYSVLVYAALVALVYVVRGGEPTTVAGLIALAIPGLAGASAAAFYKPVIGVGPAPELRLSDDDLQAIESALVWVPAESPEGELACWAEHLANSITSSSAWSADVLAPQRAGFDPGAIAEAAKAHAANIAALRAEVEAAPDGDLPEQVAARAALEYETKLIDGMVETLRYRVAGLWLYNESITELSQRVHAMTILEGSVGRARRAELAAEQMGSDLLAASELAARAADLDAVRAEVDFLVKSLAATLGITSPGNAIEEASTPSTNDTEGQ